MIFEVQDKLSIAEVQLVTTKSACEQVRQMLANQFDHV